MTPRIFDTFIFGAELDMLECRLRELDSAPIHRFVIVESAFTHQNQRKPLYFAENKARFAPWMHKIIHVITPRLPDGPDPWAREHMQREYTRMGLRTAEAGDIILHGDVDEIPSPAAITADCAGKAFGMQQAIFAVDWLDDRGPWPGTVALRAEDITGFAAMRGLRNALPMIPDAGWHLTWLGGPAGIARKLTTFCHVEDTPLISQANKDGLLYEAGRFWAGGAPLGLQLRAADVDGSWPRWVHERRCPPDWFRPREAA